MQQEPSPGDHVVLTTSLVLSGAALSGLAVLPSWQRELQVLGSPLDLGQLLSAKWLLVTLLVLLAIAGVDALVRSVPELEHTSTRFTFTTWMLPCLVTVAAASVVPSQAGNPGNWLLMILLMGGLLFAVVSASYVTLLPEARFHRISRLGLNVAAFIAAFALYYYIYGLQVRSLLSATAVVLVTFPLALELLRGTAEEVARTWLYAGVVALVVGQLTWVLNYWGLDALGGGALLLVVFYTFGGASQQHLAGRLTKRVALEFAAMGFIGTLVVWLSSSWLSG